MVGKFYKSTGMAYYGWGGAEYHSSRYEVLANVEKASDNTLRPDCRNHKQFGKHNSFVCVCTESQPCDKLEQPSKTAAGVVTRWESNRLGARLRKETLHMEPKSAHVNDGTGSHIHIKVNRDVKHQTIMGFGGAFTDATGINFKKMGPKFEDMMIRDCFGKEGLEYNIGRIPIGGSDFSTHGYAYDDNGEDKTLKNFNLTQEDFEYKVCAIRPYPLMIRGFPLKNKMCFSSQTLNFKTHFRYQSFKRRRLWPHMRYDCLPAPGVHPNG